MDKNNFLGNSEIAVIDEKYEKYQNNPDELEKSWINFFQGFDFAKEEYKKDKLKKQDCSILEKEFKVIDLIHAYRQRGHLFTKTNPVRKRRNYFPNLNISNFSLNENDLNKDFQAGNEIGIDKTKLKNIIQHLEKTYCDSIGVEYLFVRKPEVVEWLQKKMESTKNTPNYTPEVRKHIYFHLKLAVGFEQFIHKKFVGQKRFSLEGAESLIPALDSIIEKGADLGIKEFIIGMSHRGRLNVLANTLQKPYEDIFNEFSGKEYEDEISLGDVKYHLGYVRDITTDHNKKVRLTLAPNPSHLETVASVVEGITRAKIVHDCNKDFNKIAPIIIHGDAAIASQGIVYELIQMSQLKGYSTGGTIHLVINNQIGFTTNYTDGRSSTYCTDIAKVTRSPVFHVNGDDVEALIYTVRLAVEYRQRFHTDVFIDILCYRRYGHNEGDEPRFTQPTLYKNISKHLNVRDLYSKQLIEENIFSKEDIITAEKDYNEILELKLEKAKSLKKVHIYPFLEKIWKDYKFPNKEDFFKPVNTSISKEKIFDLTKKINYLPEDKKFFKKIQKLTKDRINMLENNRLDWASCELLAYSSLLEENIPVRISGQDAERGTFSHRHASYTIDESDEKYYPLKNISKNQAQFHIYNSSLSEYGVLGFEYGYALAHPNGLNVWEAQFGDFHNVAQVIIDQYISSAQEKWMLSNGLVLYLPHGFEGQGPEHSSGRMERFLTLAASNNMQIVNCTTPANFFHLIRRQMLRNFRLPLIVFTPKSLLRHPKCTSKVEDLALKQFEEVINDNIQNKSKITQIVFCTGKVYYDLIEAREKYNKNNVAIIRIEQLYPFPEKQIKGILNEYSNYKKCLWVQEEPENMGAWTFILRKFKFAEIEVVARPNSATTASGLHELHKLRHQKIMDKVFGKCTCEWANTYCDMHCVRSL